MKNFRVWLAAPLFLPLALGLLAMAFQLLLLNFPIFRADNVYSLIGAWSLLGGSGYSDISLPHHPPLLKYPPLISWPMLPWAAWFGPHLKWYRLTGALLVPLEFCLIWRLLQPRLKCTRGTLFIAGAFGIHFMLLWGNFIFGTSLFIPAVWLALLAVSKLDELQRTSSALESVSASNIGLASDSTAKNRFYLTLTRLEIGLAVALATAFYSHRMAVCLVAICGVYLCFKHSPSRAARVLGLCFLLCLPWLVRSHVYSGSWLSPEYEAEVHGRFQGAAPGAALPVAAAVYFGQQVRVLPSNLSIAVLPWTQLQVSKRLGPLRAPLNELLITLVTALIVIGWWLSVRRDASFCDWYVVAHLGMVCLFIADVSYFLVLFPLFMLYGARGLNWGLRRCNFSLRQTRRVLITGAALQFAVFVVRDKVYFDARGWPGHDERDPRWKWVSRVVPPGKSVFWLGVPAYAWAPWRFFDSGRTALGETGNFSENLVSSTRFFRDSARLSADFSADFAAAPLARRDWTQHLVKLGWREVYRENPKTAGAVTLFKRP